MQTETLRSEVIHQGRAFSVRQDEIRLPNGLTTQLDIVVHSGAAALLPIDAEGMIWFIRQYRHAAGGVLLELPAGTLEAGEDPEVCARREVREEIGMAAGRLEKLGEFYMAPGYSTEYLYVYLASELSKDPLPGDDDELIVVERIPAPQAYAMAAAGEIRDAKTLATMLLARAHLKV
ncbi:MAG: NUDIX hydrolase [Anaerolineales bacterium]|nr:NUDIX hydrolase [Anaerolineales bacterium]